MFFENITTGKVNLTQNHWLNEHKNLNLFAQNQTD